MSSPKSPALLEPAHNGGPGLFLLFGKVLGPCLAGKAASPLGPKGRESRGGSRSPRAGVGGGALLVWRGVCAFSNVERKRWQWEPQDTLLPPV